MGRRGYSGAAEMMVLGLVGVGQRAEAKRPQPRGTLLLSASAQSQRVPLPSG